MSRKSDKKKGIDTGWEEIFAQCLIHDHDFDKGIFPISAEQIKDACQNFRATGEKEVRILCAQTKRENRPQIFQDLGIFILPVKNGHYVLVKGEGYVDIPPVTTEAIEYTSELDFPLVAAKVGDSEMQHLDHAYAVSMVRHFICDKSIVPIIRGRKFTKEFAFKVGDFDIEINGVQTEVDIGYEGRDRIVLVEAKNSKTANTIIRQLYYPYRHWKSMDTKKQVSTLFFERQKIDDCHEYHFWDFEFKDDNDYNSIELLRSARYRLSE